jgi:hypothetical protein
MRNFDLQKTNYYVTIIVNLSIIKVRLKLDES